MSFFLGFFIKRLISNNLSFPFEGSSYVTQYDEKWENHVFEDGRIWVLWRKLFDSLMSIGLCVKAHSYVSTRGGEIREVRYVISPEVKKYIVSKIIEEGSPAGARKFRESLIKKIQEITKRKLVVYIASANHPMPQIMPQDVPIFEDLLRAARSCSVKFKSLEFTYVLGKKDEEDVLCCFDPIRSFL
ncbi:MAG: hypothetical protein FGF48_10535 [Candidatus Brockarchaeota archaeon]|nr:hypothetical protein [Candidatus Brockarchaeota archaeon]